MTNSKKPELDAVDAILHEAALAEAESHPSTAAERKIAQMAKTTVQARLAELRRELVPTADPVKPAKPIRRSLMQLGREALLAMLDEIRKLGGSQVQYAHRDLVGLSDDDLRRIIERLDPSAGD